MKIVKFISNSNRVLYCIWKFGIDIHRLSGRLAYKNRLRFLCLSLQGRLYLGAQWRYVWVWPLSFSLDITSCYAPLRLYVLPSPISLSSLYCSCAVFLWKIPLEESRIFSLLFITNIKASWISMNLILTYATAYKVLQE